MACIFCNCCDGKLTALTKKGAQTIINASKSRQDNLHQRFVVEESVQHYVHEKCRKLYTDARNIRKCMSAINPHVTSNIVDDIICTAPDSVVATQIPQGACTSASSVSIACTSTSVVLDTPAADATSVSQFDYKSCCLLCSKTVMTNKRQDVVVVKQRSTQQTLSNMVHNSDVDEHLRNRISGVDLLAVSARYHKKCYAVFPKQMKTSLSVSVSAESDPDSVPCTDDTVRDGHDTFEAVVAGTELALSVLRVTDCGVAQSHAQYLTNVAVTNRLQLIPTVGGGDCFFDAVHFGLMQHGLQRTVQELRELAAIELGINRHIYAPVYHVEDDVQAATYDSFIERTRRSTEWATELTVCAMARGLGMVIRVVSTAGTSRGQPTAFVKDYDDGVPPHAAVVTVGYNAAEGHYVGLTSPSVPALMDVQSHGQCVPLTSVTGRDSVADQPMSTGSISIVQQDEDVDPVSMSIGSLSGVTLACGYEAMEDDVFAEHLVAAIPTHDNDGSSMSVSSDHYVGVHQPREEGHMLCDNCRRIPTDKFALGLRSCSGKFIPRQFRLLAADSVDYVLCKSCHTYLSTKLSPSKLWCHGWPSVIACLLTLNKFSYVRSDVWSILPTGHRECWRLHAISVGMTSVINTPSLFADFTDDVARYNALTKSGNIADFMSAMSDYAFPCVKCPAGCFSYVDECTNVPFNNYLDWKFGLTFFNGQRKYLHGSRADWPMSSVQLGTFTVMPGLVVDCEQGLCFLMCATHGKGLLKSFVHVPRNPVLGDFGFQVPDTCAAAILTPNVLRAGRMGKWTNSSHVVTAVGGYSGISSSSICHKYDTVFKDERLSSSCCLAMTHRPDIFQVCHNRYADMPGGDEELKRVLDVYDMYGKPSRAEEQSCLAGATFVDIHHSFLMNERMFGRDTTHCDVQSNVPQVDSLQYALTFVHPSTGNGCAPVNLTSLYNVQKHVITGALLHLLIHCPAFHKVLLRSFELSRENYVATLLKFAQSCAGQAKNQSGIRNANECEELSRTQLVTRKLPVARKCESVAKLVTSLSSSIWCQSFSIGDDMQRLSVPKSADLVVIYNSDGRRRMLDPLAVHFHDFTLVSVLSGPHLTDNVYFRWNELFNFWKVTCDTKGQTNCSFAGETFVVPRWQVVVYAKTENKTVMHQQLLSNLNAQHRMRCAIHDLFLVKQPLTCSLPCCVQHCSRSARWCCTARGSSCPHGICLTHGKDICNGDAIVDIEVAMSGRTLRQVLLPQVADSVRDSRCPVNSLSTDSDFDLDDDDIDGRVLAPIGIDDIVSYTDPPALHSRKDIIPVYDVNRTVPAHYLWNNQYNVMRRVNRYPDVRTNAMLQHIVSSTNDASVSLLYPEAQLFPRIFWCEKSHSVVGAIPSFMLNSTTKQLPGMASVMEHHNIRMKDGDLLTCKQSTYWHYVFDMKLNLALNSSSSDVIFKRGFEFLSDRNAQLHIGGSLPEAKLPMDEAESTRRIKELASLLKKGKWTYFLTLTVNDMETPGVREITRAIKSHCCGDRLLESQLIDAFLPFTLRAWERFVRIFLQELILRNDSIVGKVSNIFYRFEFQGAGAKGNKPHVHCGITLVDEAEEISVGRICCLSTAFHSSLYGTDFETLHDAGIFRDEAEYNRWCTVVSHVNHHDCRKTQFRCLKATSADGTKICRYHRQPRLPVDADSRGWFEEITMPYPEDVYELLQEIGLAHQQVDHVLQENRWVVNNSLRAGKWHYAAASDEFFLASIPLVSAICRSSTNVDMCDRKFQVSYLVKYISGKEEHQLVDVAGTKEVTEVKVTTEDHAHEKITSCRKIMSAKEKTNPHLGREVSLAEVVWFVFGFPYTYCNADFVHVSTLPLDNRVGIVRSHKLSSKVYMADSTDLVAVQGRIAAGLPQWRWFTDQQQVHIEDYMNAPYCCDVTSSFNIRPPELLYFTDLQQYSECFVSLGTVKCLFHLDLRDQQWFDGLCHLVKLRACSVNKAVSHTLKCMHLGDSRATAMWNNIFQQLTVGNEELVKRFVHPTQSTQVVSVISLVKPWDSCKFLTHIALSLGKYETEVDLFCQRTLRDAYIKAGLLSSIEPTTRMDVLKILRQYVLDDLRFHPISARQFGKYLKAAMKTLHDCLIDGVLRDYTPCLSNVMLKEEATVCVTEKELHRKQSLVNALVDDAAISPSLPSNLADATLANPLHWIPCIAPVDGISDNAIVEQTNALGCCVDAINKFMDPLCRGLKFTCLVGRAGSGKSHVLKLAVAYAISKGLHVELMSWTSERARKLGGNHLHMVFPLQVMNTGVQFAHDIAVKCLRTLNKDALKKSILQRTDVFVFEEIGMLSAEYFAALDNILRTVKGNSLPWGGTLLLSCGDAKQLPPIDGRPIWASINMCTMMDVFVFTADVRARDDNLRWLNNECRRALTPTECTAVADVVIANCQFVHDWAAVPDVAVRIVPTKAAEIQVMQQFLHSRQTRTYRAVDEVQNGAVWEPAATSITKRLNTNCYEYDVCQLYLNAIVRMTYNERHANIQFSQGQVAVVVELPDDSLQFGQQRLTLRLAPPGIRHIDISDIPADWPHVVVGPRTTPPSIVGKYLQMGRRTQFPVRYYMCSTIHRIQGDTVPMLATEMSLSKREYKLWQKEQFAVLISRVQTCHDIIFVGSPTDTHAAIQQIMSGSSKWDNLIDHYLSQLNIANSSPHVPTIELDVHPFLPLYRELPASTCGYVYLLVSLVATSHYYIDETMDLKKCLRLHNTGYGPQETQNTLLHPWAIFAFICGFEQMNDVDASSEARREFARMWKCNINSSMDVEQVYNRVHQVATDWSECGWKLVVVKCGQTEGRRDAVHSLHDLL